MFAGAGAVIAQTVADFLLQRLRFWGVNRTHWAWAEAEGVYVRGGVDDIAAHRLELFHDIRVVRAPEKPQ
jgi:hypothetical protein